MAEESGGNEQVTAAVAALQAYAEVSVSAPDSGGDPQLPPVKFDRLSTERRVLGHITDEVDVDRLGPRNTLVAITQSVMTDRNTTNPPPDKPRLLLDGTLANAVEAVLQILNALVEAGLVKQYKDGRYVLTDAGHLELAS